MNIHNLKKMYNHILTVPSYLLDMADFRENRDDFYVHECNTIGCIIGHCVHLDNIENIPLTDEGCIMFFAWSEQYTGIDRDSREWLFLFSTEWSGFSATNTKAQILGRLKEFIFERQLGFGFLWDWDYDYLVTNPKYLDQTPFEL